MAERIPIIVSRQKYETYIGGINCLFVCLFVFWKESFNNSKNFN